MFSPHSRKFLAVLILTAIIAIAFTYLVVSIAREPNPAGTSVARMNTITFKSWFELYNSKGQLLYASPDPITIRGAYAIMSILFGLYKTFSISETTSEGEILLGTDTYYRSLMRDIEDKMASSKVLRIPWSAIDYTIEYDKSKSVWRIAGYIQFALDKTVTVYEIGIRRLYYTYGGGGPYSTIFFYSAIPQGIELKPDSYVLKYVIEIPSKSNAGLTKHGVGVIAAIIFGKKIWREQDAALLLGSDCYGDIFAGSMCSSRILSSRSVSGSCYVDPAKRAYVCKASFTYTAEKTITIYEVGIRWSKTSTALYAAIPEGFTANKGDIIRLDVTLVFPLSIS